MDKPDVIFFKLFHEACRKCFGYPLASPLGEADAKQLSNTILGHTGLLIGPKSIRNYSLYVLTPETAKPENPSIATLDTLARYILNAPPTDDIQRKRHESHHPYYYQFRNGIATDRPHTSPLPAMPKKHSSTRILVFAAVTILVLGVIIIYWLSNRNTSKFMENFNSMQTDTLKHHGWILMNPDAVWWDKRDSFAGHLSLYTLPGDNWPTHNQQTRIHNALVRKLPDGCFAVEIQLSRFIPTHNWQQAGIILSEDTTRASKAIRISLGYNDFFGGYAQPAEIIIQGMSSTESARHSNPEEFAHIPLFTLKAGDEQLVADNLAASALKIERKGDQYRFLYATGTMAGFAYKEATSKTFSIEPRYITLFAIQGTTTAEAPVIPAHFDSFILTSVPCH